MAWRAGLLKTLTYSSAQGTTLRVDDHSTMPRRNDAAAPKARIDQGRGSGKTQ